MVDTEKENPFMQKKEVCAFCGSKIKRKRKSKRKQTKRRVSFNTERTSNKVSDGTSQQQHWWDSEQLEFFVDLCWIRKNGMRVAQNKRKWRKEDHKNFVELMTAFFREKLKPGFNRRSTKQMWKWLEKNYNKNPQIKNKRSLKKLQKMMKFAHDVNMVDEEEPRNKRQPVGEKLNWFTGYYNGPAQEVPYQQACLTPGHLQASSGQVCYPPPPPPYSYPGPTPYAPTPNPGQPSGFFMQPFGYSGHPTPNLLLAMPPYQ